MSIRPVASPLALPPTVCMRTCACRDVQQSPPARAPFPYTHRQVCDARQVVAAVRFLDRLPHGARGQIPDLRPGERVWGGWGVCGGGAWVGGGRVRRTGRRCTTTCLPPSQQIAVSSSPPKVRPAPPPPPLPLLPPHLQGPQVVGREEEGVRGPHAADGGKVPALLRRQHRHAAPLVTAHKEGRGPRQNGTLARCTHEGGCGPGPHGSTAAPIRSAWPP